MSTAGGNCQACQEIELDDSQPEIAPALDPEFPASKFHAYECVCEVNLIASSESYAILTSNRAKAACQTPQAHSQITLSIRSINIDETR